MIFKKIKKPEEWKEFLGAPDKHWKDSYSAKELAYCWQKCSGKFPNIIQEVFNQNHLEYKINYLFAVPEYKVSLPGGGLQSANDLFIFADINHSLCPIMVEGKRNESFDITVDKWKKSSKEKKVKNKKTNREFRYDEIIKKIGIDNKNIIENEQYYQLFHRTASAIETAIKYHTNQCMVLIHHINGDNMKTFNDYQNFVSMYGFKKNQIKENQILITTVNGIKLMFLWVEDKNVYTKDL